MLSTRLLMRLAHGDFAHGQPWARSGSDWGAGLGGRPKPEDQPPARRLLLLRNSPCRSIVSCEGFHCAYQLRNRSTPRDGFCRVEAMFESVLIPLRCSRRQSAVHPTSAVRHRRRSATSSAANVGTDKDSEKRQRVSIEAFAKRTGLEIVDWFYDPAVTRPDAIEGR